VPNIYPIAVLLSSCVARRQQSAELNEVLLSQTARHVAAHANKYAVRCEQFIQQEHELLYPPGLKKCPANLARNYSWLSQTEFHEIILWGRRRFNTEKKLYIEHLDERTAEVNGLIKILSNKIQSD